VPGAHSGQTQVRARSEAGTQRKIRKRRERVYKTLSMRVHLVMTDGDAMCSDSVRKGSSPLPRGITIELRVLRWDEFRSGSAHGLPTGDYFKYPDSLAGPVQTEPTLGG